MKKLTKTLLGLFVGLMSFSTISIADTVSEHRILLQKTISGGYVPKDMAGWTDIIEIRNNGTVWAFSKNNAADPGSYLKLGKLSNKLNKKLKQIISNSPDGELVFAKGPICADAPETEYSSPKHDKVFFIRENCQNASNPDFAQAHLLKQVLDGYSIQYQLIK